MILSLVDAEVGPYTQRLVSAAKAPNVHLTLGPRFRRASRTLARPRARMLRKSGTWYLQYQVPIL